MPNASSAASRTWLERLWASIAERGRREDAGGAGPLERAQLLAEALLSERGEASGAALSRELHAMLRDLAAAERQAFLEFVATHFAPEPTQLEAAARAYLDAPGPETARVLADIAEPPRQELLRRMNLSPGGTAALVKMREEVLSLLRAHPALAPLDNDLRHLFGSWFNRGFLELRRIDWQTPAAVLEKLIEYEAVHEIAGWDDLRRRLAPDRRCFGFFHPALPGEPLIFVEVALVHGLATAIAPLLANDESEDARAREARADTAIFYSISNCQDGLRGVSFGNFLIKQVVEELRAERPGLSRFATLSPVPSFRRWLDRALAPADGEPQADTPPLLREEERASLAAFCPTPAEGFTDAALLATALGTPHWWENPGLADALRGPVMRLAAACLAAAGGRGGDPVARFHLGNGARLEQVNWMGNTSARGLRESHGLMVNYLYATDAIEANHEAFVRDGSVARSVAVEALMAPIDRPGRKPSRLALLRRV